MALESVINYVIKTRTDHRLICPSEKYWQLVLLQGILAVLILLFRILISLLVYSTLDIVSPSGLNTSNLLWLAFIWSLPINNLCYNVWIFPCFRYARIKIVAKQFLLFLKQVDHGRKTNHLILSLVYWGIIWNLNW